DLWVAYANDSLPVADRNLALGQSGAQLAHDALRAFGDIWAEHRLVLARCFQGGQLAIEQAGWHVCVGTSARAISNQCRYTGEVNEDGGWFQAEDEVSVAALECRTGDDQWCLAFIALSQLGAD